MCLIKDNEDRDFRRIGEMGMLKDSRKILKEEDEILI